MNVGDTLFAVTPSGDKLFPLVVQHAGRLRMLFSQGYWAYTPFSGMPTVRPLDRKRGDEECKTFLTEGDAREYMEKLRQERVRSAP